MVLYRPYSVHKVLIYGATIIKFALLSIGHLSERAHEAKNKDIRRYMEHDAQKSSRLNTIEDLLNNLPVSSDPFIIDDSLRKSHNDQRKGRLPETKLLLTQRIDEEENQNVDPDY